MILIQLVLSALAQYPALAIHIDLDGDGLSQQADCNDHDASVPGGFEFAGDQDGDAYPHPLSGSQDFLDCNDCDPTIHWFAVETVGDGIDQNCDGSDLI